ncbi:MAG: DUF2493 domain-containing protein [Pseudonocardiaceae bacterium]
MSTRILVTGSRSWTDNETIRTALQPWRKVEGAVLIHGDAVGADRIAAAIWRRWGLPTEVHHANWATRGRAAGMLRNNHMVSLGAQVCLAFIHNNSPGASQCAETAEQAGIRTYRHRKKTPIPTPSQESAHQGNTDLFGTAVPDDTLSYQPTNDPEEVHAVLKIAHSDGYAVTGRRCEQIWRREPGNHIVAVPRHEADTVRQLIDYQWLHLGGGHRYQDKGEELYGRAVLVPKTTKQKLKYWEGLKVTRGQSWATGGSGR